MTENNLTFVEINLSNLAFNIKTIKDFLNPKTKLMAVVKSNAYGHGIVQVAKEAVKAGADSFGVFQVSEGELLRKNRIKLPILVFGPAGNEDIIKAIKHDLILSVYNLDYAKSISRTSQSIGKRARIHAKVDTGMRRLGVRVESGVEFIQNLKKLPRIDLEGVYSHFASAGSTDKTYTFKQLGAFQSFIIELDRQGLKPPVVHIANSAAMLEIPSSHCDLVRCGIAIYGLFSTTRLRNFFDLKPVMTIKSQIIDTRKLISGEKVGYEGTYVAAKPTIMGVVPIGYAHGFDFHFSNMGKMLVGGKRAQVIGRVGMELTCIDLSEAPDAKVGDEVVVLGSQGGETITAGELSGYLGTINYEIVSRINPNLPRIYIRK